MTMNAEALRKSAGDFLDEIFTWMKSENFSIQHWSIDHLCYRVSNVDHYEERKNDFSRFSDLLVESEVNGRPISTFKLKEPIHFKGRIIDLIELPAPKSGKEYTEGFEHIEVVIPIPFQELIDAYPHLNFDSSALDKHDNQEIKLRLDEFQIKFHHSSLESVINLEKNQKVFSMVKKSKILHQLRAYNPLIAGTFPLGIDNAKSDIDLILCAPDLTELQGAIRRWYRVAPGFQDRLCKVDGVSSYIANFVLLDIPIEIFAQHAPSVKQTAYSHFHVEEKLLKVGGCDFRNTIMKYRQQGFKTEESFAKALNLTGDPYDAILGLQDKTEEELKQLIVADG